MAKLFEGKLSSIKKVVYKKGSSTSEPNVVDFDKKAKWAKPFTLSYPALPKGVKSYSITIVTTITEKELGVIVNSPSSKGSTEVNFKDGLKISALQDSGWEPPKASLSSEEVVNNITATVQAGEVVTSTLKYPGTPSGLTQRITITSSPKKGSRLGDLITPNVSSGGQMTIYAGDTLSMSVNETSADYEDPIYGFGDNRAKTIVVPDTTTIIQAYIQRGSSRWIPLTYNNKSGSEYLYYGADIYTYTKFRIIVSCDTRYTYYFTSGDVTERQSYSYPSSGPCPDCGIDGEHWCACYGETRGWDGGGLYGTVRMYNFNQGALAVVVSGDTSLISVEGYK